MAKDGYHRRQVLWGSAAAAGALLGARRAKAGTLPPRLLGNCPIPTQSAVEGPFYFDPGIVAQDIGAGELGLPIRLYLRVLDGNGCGPVVGHLVDVWQASVAGAYSGYASEGNAGQTFLRGTQITNAAGVVRFDTVFPGWYPGRAPHIHVKVREPGGRALLTTQVYVPTVVSDWVYANVPDYGLRGPADTSIAQDAFYATDGLLATALIGGVPHAGGTLTLASP